MSRAYCRWTCRRRMAAFAELFFQLANGDLTSAIEARLPGLPDNNPAVQSPICSDQLVIAVRQTREMTNLRELASYTESPRLTHAGYRLLNTTHCTVHGDQLPQPACTTELRRSAWSPLGVLLQPWRRIPAKVCASTHYCATIRGQRLRAFPNQETRTGRVPKLPFVLTVLFLRRFRFSHSC
jgi:hypothetical protein